MSIAIIKIDKSKVGALKQIVKALEAKIRVVKEKDYEEEIMNKLIEAGIESEIIYEKIF